MKLKGLYNDRPAGDAVVPLFIDATFEGGLLGLDVVTFAMFDTGIGVDSTVDVTRGEGVVVTGNAVDDLICETSW